MRAHAVSGQHRPARFLLVLPIRARVRDGDLLRLDGISSFNQLERRDAWLLQRERREAVVLGRTERHVCTRQWPLTIQNSLELRRGTVWFLRDLQRNQIGVA